MGDYDVIVIGGGFSGAVMAERFANLQNKRVLVIEQRAHIAGNCFDYVNEAGILVHHYGPHLFHTNKSAVWDYLSQFTEWTPYEHKVLAAVDSKLVPIPFNLNTLEMMFSHDEAEALKQCLIATYGFDSKVPILELRQSPDAKLRELAECVYEKFFVNYTTKQWGCSPEQISPSVTARVPVVISRDDRYFQDRYQAIPKEGYTKLVAKILAHPNITVTLNTDATSLIKLDVQSRTITFKGQPFNGTLVFTGMLDQLFAYCHGELPYRSLQFDFQTLDLEQFQAATTVNYPNEHRYTRITEFKHILGQKSAQTTIVKEYPQDYDRLDPTKNVPYYPIFNDQNQQRFDAYKTLVDGFTNIITAGRLADYKYYNMDDAIANALNYFVAKDS
ncbi:MAG: UDP-galactopyranose mutase [Paraglaciecola sp.]|nr:UDP-galactopyranose mutase [Paraglaciecola sp.]